VLVWAAQPEWLAYWPLLVVAQPELSAELAEALLLLLADARAE
jgi:hypothetical protein